MITVKLEFHDFLEASEALALLAKKPTAEQKLDRALDKAIDAAIVLPEAKPKRGRPAKVQEPVEAPAPVQEPKAEAPVVQEPKTVAAVDGTHPTVDKVREALLAFVKKHGKDAGFALLTKYKAKLIQDVAEADRAALISEASLN